MAKRPERSNWTVPASGIAIPRTYQFPLNDSELHILTAFIVSRLVDMKHLTPGATRTQTS